MQAAYDRMQAAMHPYSVAPALQTTSFNSLRLIRTHWSTRGRQPERYRSHYNPSSQLHEYECHDASL